MPDDRRAADLKLIEAALGMIGKRPDLPDDVRELLDAAREKLAALAKEHRPLIVTADDGTNEPSPMEAQIAATKSRAAKISATKAARRKAELPWQKALQIAGITAQEWAARQRNPPLDEGKARSWMKRPGRGGRAIPRSWADRIAKEFPGVPAIDASWPSGIRD